MSKLSQGHTVEQNDSVRIERSRRRSIVLSVNSRAEVLLKVPYRTTNAEINRILFERQDWIRTHVARVQSARASADTLSPLTDEELRQLSHQAAQYIPPRVALYAERIGVSYGRITIRHQRTRWGSCSTKGNLNFNCLLMLTPPEVIDYVIVHELCHRKEMNHSARFWTLVASILPDYTEQKRWLREHGGVIIGRLEA